MLIAEAPTLKLHVTCTLGVKGESALWPLSSSPTSSTSTSPRRLYHRLQWLQAAKTTLLVSNTSISLRFRC